MSYDFLDTIKKNEGVIFKLVRIYADQYDDQKDLYQEIVYQLWKSFNSFQGKSKISTWIYKVALNTSLAHINLKKKHSKTISIQDIRLPIEEENDTQHEDKITEMYQHIKQLNKIDRAIIFLFLEGKNYEEIAAITGFTITNIGTRLNRIKLKLKNQIAK
nr:sigma-70 family RNA polymerase sigma factor [uncultured Flavobacterium sp.]